MVGSIFGAGEGDCVYAIFGIFLPISTRFSAVFISLPDTLLGAFIIYRVFRRL